MFERWKVRRHQRLAMHELARLSPHLLRDMGLEGESFRDPVADRVARLVLTRHPRGD